jgi:replication initiation protein RepC
MHSNSTTTPFGRRPLTLAMVASQADAKACAPDTAVHKWHVLNAVRDAMTALGVSDRTLAVLSALLTFHPETTLTGEGDITVFPSNESLTQRACGMGESTLRRHLAVLVERGLVIRRDSPNGKRYARRGQGGVIEKAFGFDLTPLVARAAEFESLAEAARAERKARDLLRERISLCRRDIEKMIATGREEDVPSDWDAFQAAYDALATPIRRRAPLVELDPVADELETLANQILEILEAYTKTIEMSGNARQNERHKQNSNTYSQIEFEHGLPISQGATIEAHPKTPRPPQRSYPLGMVLDACPDIVDHARSGIASWRDFVATASVVRPFLGISPSAWEEAKEVLGPEDAAVVVAAILQRASAIKSAGGYLRSLTEKARVGAFSLGPVLMALINTNLRDPGRKRG